MAADPNQHDRFFMRQRVRLVVNQYEISTLGADGASEGEPVCFVEQRRFKLKEDLRAFADDSKAVEVFRIKAQKVWDPRATYDVTDSRGELIGRLRKLFKKSLLRSTWELQDASGQAIGFAHETSVTFAILRRIQGFFEAIPLIGIVLAYIPIPYHFAYHLGERRIGELSRLISIRDRYRLDLSEDPGRELDRRLALALAAGMDAMQAR